MDYDGPNVYTLKEAVALPNQRIPGTIAGGATYNVMGEQFMFVDSRFRSAGNFVETPINSGVRVPGKTMMIHCSWYGPSSFGGIWGQLLNGQHNGSETFLFVDGHAASYKSQPNIEYWEKNGGPSGSHSAYVYTYLPKANSTFRRPAGDAEWWVVPWYPNRPEYYYGTSILPK